MDEQPEPPTTDEDVGSGVSRRTVMALASAVAVLSLMARDLAQESAAFAAVDGYNLPFTSLDRDNGAAIPTYDWRDGFGSTANRPRPHSGIDFTNLDGQGSITGRPIYPIRSGRTITSAWDDSWGQHVVIRHSDGSRSLYAHLSSRTVGVNVDVSPSSMLGYLGNTGESYGAHLHLTMYNSNGNLVDPWPFLDGAPYSNEGPNMPTANEITQELRNANWENGMGGYNTVSVMLAHLHGRQVGYGQRIERIEGLCDQMQAKLDRIITKIGA